VVAVCPGSVETPVLRTSAELFKGNRTIASTLDSWGAMHPIGRIGRPEQVAEVIAFLASPRASFITGGKYKIDCGLTTQRAVVYPEDAS